jgi:hypothetical protein
MPTFCAYPDGPCSLHHGEHALHPGVEPKPEARRTFIVQLTQAQHARLHYFTKELSCTEEEALMLCLTSCSYLPKATPSDAPIPTRSRSKSVPANAKYGPARPARRFR